MCKHTFVFIIMWEMFPVMLPPITSLQVTAEEQCSVQNVVNLSFNGRGLDNKVGVAYTCMCQIIEMLKEFIFCEYNCIIIII